MYIIISFYLYFYFKSVSFLPVNWVYRSDWKSTGSTKVDIIESVIEPFIETRPNKWPVPDWTLYHFIFLLLYFGEIGKDDGE